MTTSPEQRSPVTSVQQSFLNDISEEESLNIPDGEAIILQTDECRIAVTGEVEEIVKEIEKKYFEKVVLEDTLLFGGTLGKSAGGITAFTVAANGKLVAQANSNGSLLVYDTEQFNLIRLFEGNKFSHYNHLEFSTDNCSQLIAMSEGGILSTFLLKGYVPPANLQSQYIDPKKILMHEDKPLLLIPFYNVSYNNFLTEANQHNAQQYYISSAIFNPMASVTAFQNSIMIGTQGGTIMRWNSNINLSSMKHDPYHKIYGHLFGKSVQAFEPDFP